MLVLSPRDRHNFVQVTDGCGLGAKRDRIAGKALVGFISFVVALISLAALRNFGPVLYYIGVAIFATVGLVIAGAIMGAVI